MKRSAILSSPRLLGLKRHRQRIALAKIFIFIASFAAILGSLAYISRVSRLNISTVEITGNKFLDSEIIKTAVEKKLAGSYFFSLFPKTNILLYPKNKIKTELQNEFRRLKDINLSLRDGKILEVAVSERTPSFMWCGPAPFEPGSKEKPKCNFLDDSGFIFDEAPYFSGEVYFKFYGADLSEINFDKIISFKKTLEEGGLKPIALYLQANGDTKIFLSPKNGTSTEPYLILKSDSDFEIVAENLRIALATEPLKTNFKNKYASLLYIDLRFGNKVYFKFR